MGGVISGGVALQGMKHALTRASGSQPAIIAHALDQLELVDLACNASIACRQAQASLDGLLLLWFSWEHTSCSEKQHVMLANPPDVTMFPGSVKQDPVRAELEALLDSHAC